MIEFIAILNLIIAAQSLFLSLHFLFKNKSIRRLKLIMALITFSFSLIVFNTYYSLSNFTRFDLLQDIANNIMWFIGPSLYLYVIFKQDGEHSKTIWVHYLPYFVPAFIDIFFEWNWFNSIIAFVAFSQMTIYLLLSLIISLSNYQEKKSYYAWIFPMLLSFSVLVVLNFIINIGTVLDFFTIESTIRQSFTTLLIIPIFYLSYKEMNATNEFGLIKEKYKQTKLTAEKTAEILETLQRLLITEKLFKVQSVTLNDLSKQSGIPSKYISQVINSELAMSFSDYLLDLRISEAKKSLVDQNKQHLSIAGIASECGFASSSRFNHQFKKSTGFTPSEFQKNASI